MRFLPGWKNVEKIEIIIKPSLDVRGLRELDEEKLQRQPVDH
jgi:hypothetical protein